MVLQWDEVMEEREIAEGIEKRPYFEAPIVPVPYQDDGTREMGELYPFLISGGSNTEHWYFTHINDTTENINSILDSCIDADVKGIICYGMGLTLRKGNREYFYSKLDKHFPGLKDRYIKEFKNSYSIPSPNSDRLMSLFIKKTSQNGILNNPREIFEYLNEFPQKSRQTKLI